MKTTTNKRIEALKSIAEEIASIETAEEQIPLLSKGFELFSIETARLSKAYAHLHTQFRKVNHKLEYTNERLSNKVQELRALNAYLDNILSHMSQGILFIDSRGHITTYNKAAELLLEKQRKAVLFHEFSSHFDDGQFGYSMKLAFSDGKAPKVTHISLSFPDGRQKELEVSSTFAPHPSIDESKTDPGQGLIVLLRDVTEFRKLQILASRRDRMQALGEMAAQLAHEIRNPLGGIKGFASLLHRDLKGKKDLLRLTDYIIEGTNTLDRLVTQVLNFSRPLHLELKNINLQEILKELKETLFAENALPQSVHFTLSSKDKIFSSIDAGLLKAALHNLLINAVQAMPEGGKLGLKLSSSENRAVIQISDTGIGIPEEHLKNLFSPFFSTKPDGNGLGLAEAHKVIQGHGGEISVESTPGLGTCFTIKLPLQL